MKRAILFFCLLFWATDCRAQSQDGGDRLPLETEETSVKSLDSVGQSFSSNSETIPWGLTPADLFPFRSGDSSLTGVGIQPDERRRWSLVSGFGYETFRGFPDRGWQANGLYGNFNVGTSLGALSDWTGLGLQGGFSRGLYDWEGNPYRANVANTARQDFASYGLFKRATQSNPLTLSVSQDWMFTENYGRNGLSLNVSQIRYRAGVATSSSNEFGVVGAFRVVEDTDSVGSQLETTRAVNHASAFWHHKWEAWGANTIISLGAVENDRVSGDGSLGDLLVTATVDFPFTDKVGFYGNIAYMNPSATAGFDAAHEEFWSFTLGVQFFPGHDAKTMTIAGERWRPLLPVANNGVFILDSVVR